MKLDMYPEPHLKLFERRKAPRSGEITGQEMLGAAERVLKEAKLSEINDMKEMILATLKNTWPTESSEMKQPSVIEEDRQQNLSEKFWPIDEDDPRCEEKHLKLRKIIDLYDSDFGIEKFTLPMLQAAGIDPFDLSEGSQAFWHKDSLYDELPYFLQSNLTEERIDIIDKYFVEPAIVVEPIIDWRNYFKFFREWRDNMYNFGKTTFSLSQWGERYLDLVNKKRDNLQNPLNKKDQIVRGWRAGVADVSRGSILPSDGDIYTKTVADRLRDFYLEGFGKAGFASMMDYPILYALFSNKNLVEGVEYIDFSYRRICKVKNLFPPILRP